jgi:hypothetical protein
MAGLFLWTSLTPEATLRRMLEGTPFMQKVQTEAIEQRIEKGRSAFLQTFWWN